MVPVNRVQVGWAVTLATGITGLEGCAATVTLAAALVHPSAFLAVIL